jgi:hypothetical protein
MFSIILLLTDCKILMRNMLNMSSRIKTGKCQVKVSQPGVKYNI